MSFNSIRQFVKSDIFKVALLALSLVIFSFGLQGDILINLADEGFFWYGTLQTAAGEVPIRDFQSYDPGRYYWTAGWSFLLGSGIIGLRASVAIFQFLGLTFGLAVFRKRINSWWILSVVGALLLLWMYPRHKIFEHSISMAAVYFAVLLIENPTIRRHFAVGIFVGLMAFFGRNHGFYGFISFSLLIFYLFIKTGASHFFKKTGAWVVGIVVGYSPMLLMFILIPDFFEKFMHSILFLFRIKGTNLPLPVPWPWTVNFSQMNIIASVNSIFSGTFFLLLPVFYITSGVYLLKSKRNLIVRNTAFVASIFVGICYMHYVFSRADIAHLSQGIHPFLIGLLSFPFLLNYKFKKVFFRALLAVVLIMSLFSVGMVQPYFQKANASQGMFVKMEVLDDKIWEHRCTADLINCVKKINEQHVLPGEELLIAPSWPGFYPILQRKSPLWDIYFLFPETRERQIQMISNLREKNVNWVISGDIARDGRDDLRFRNTHKIVWHHFNNDFTPIKVDCLIDNYSLLKRK